MNRPRWSKVLHDLWDHKARTFLVMLTIAVGVFAVGFVGDLFFITLGDLDRNYQVANPHGAILYTDLFDNDLIPALEKIPGIGDVEGRNGLFARVQRPDGEWLGFDVTAIPPVDQIRVDKLRPEKPGGMIPPLGEKEVYLDRSVHSILQVEPGETIQIELSDGTLRELHVADYVFDVTAVPYFFGQTVYAYTSPDTLVWLGGSEEHDRLYMTVEENQRDEAHVRNIAQSVADKLEDGGRQVYFTFIFQPGRHFASDITASLGAMMMFLGLLSVGLSAFLVVNTLNALLNQQVRQIGVMKAVGAATQQLVGMYLVLTLFYGLLALAVAIPLGALVSTTTGSGITNMLNFDPSPFHLAPESVALQAIVALVIPLAAATLPVIKSTRITVREAITNYGIGRGTFGKSLIDRLVERIRSLPRPFLISIRNTFRRKGRLFLTLSTLILAGAIFIGVYNLRAAMDASIKETLGYVLSDVNVGFGRAYRLQKVQSMALSVPGVVKAEAWGGALGSLLMEDEQSGTQIQILAPPADSTLIKASITSGRWLLPEDENAIVIGNHLIAVRPELKVGDEVVLDIDGVKNNWKIVGIYRFIGNAVPPLLYANNDYLSRVTHTQNMAGSLRVVTDQHDPAYQKRVARDLERVFRAEGIEISTVVIGSDIVKANTSTTDVLVLFLMIMSVLIALVGGLGMTSTMSINVFERTREIGVMRAIGASNGAIMRLVIVEGMIIGVISWIIGTVLAVPISLLLDNVVGITILRSPLKYVFSFEGFLIWLAMVLVIAALACAMPARNAVRLTVREVLAYE
jgi:putative ABC transport system permease protein